MKYQFERKEEVSFIFDDSSEFKNIYSLKINQYNKVFLIYDKLLKKIWVDRIINKLISHNKIILIPLKASEDTKSIPFISKISNQLEKKKCSKSDVIISIGGGTILDISSFVASVYMRGIDLIMIPTTLMGQADASSAGKTCVNGVLTKNLLGTLYMPKIVYNNVNLLKTAGQYSFRQGMSEIFKYGLLGSKKLLHLLNEYVDNPTNKLLIRILKETIKVRISLVKIDPLKSNLGHTFGHAFEYESNHKVAHGDAISAGIKLALKKSFENNLLSKQEYLKTCKLMKKLNLNIKIDKKSDLNKVVDFMKKDKKSDGINIGLILLKRIGDLKINSSMSYFFISQEDMKKFLTESVMSENLLSNNQWSNLLKNKI